MKKDGKKRVWFLLIFCTAVFAAFLVRLYWMQFTMADHYAKKLEQASQTSYTVRIPAARGSIVDRSGTALVQDDTVYDLALCVPAPPDTEMAQTLQTLKELDLGGKDVETQLAAFCSAVSAGELTLAENLTQAQCQSLLAAGLPQSGAVRLTARGTRTAVDGALAPQLLGGVGAMSAEQWAQKKAQGLAMDESIGQWGLEAAWEDALRGRAGSLKVTVDRSSGGRTETIQSTPQAGDTLHLYLDADLQRTLRSALQQQIETLQATKPEGKGKEACAGAAVVVDVQTGGVLAAVSLPDYDLASWRQNYAALAAAQGAPLVNRVLNGQYAPGSAFKPAVAASALAAGIITPQSTVNCGGRYTYYAGYQPRCLQLGHRGAVSMVTALRHSCNIYFYDVGRRLGVDTFSATAQQLGLGAPCGTELPETTGRLTWSTDENYQAGLALMAAIGQGNTSVSPLQLAAYAGALARDGQRPALHFAQSTTDAAGNITWQAQPEVLAQAPGGAAVFAPHPGGDGPDGSNAAYFAGIAHSPCLQDRQPPAGGHAAGWHPLHKLGAHRVWAGAAAAVCGGGGDRIRRRGQQCRARSAGCGGLVCSSRNGLNRMEFCGEFLHSTCRMNFSLFVHRRGGENLWKVKKRAKPP